MCSSDLGATDLAWAREQLSFCIVLSLNNAYYQVREWEAKAFYELARIELDSRSLSELLRRCVESLVQTYRADCGRLYLLNEDRSAWSLKAASPFHDAFSAQNRPALSKVLAKPAYFDTRRKDLILDPGWRKAGYSTWSMPLKLEGSEKVAGVLQLGFTREHEWLPREIEFLTAAAERCMRAAEKQRLAEELVQREEQVRKLAEHMLHVEEVERQRISRELHDEAGDRKSTRLNSSH